MMGSTNWDRPTQNHRYKIKLKCNSVAEWGLYTTNVVKASTECDFTVSLGRKGPRYYCYKFIWRCDAGIRDKFLVSVIYRVALLLLNSYFLHGHRANPCLYINFDTRVLFAR